MKILMVGQPLDIFMEELIVELKKQIQVEIDVLALGGLGHFHLKSSANRVFFFNSKMPFNSLLNYFYSYIKLIFLKNSYDIVHFHGLSCYPIFFRKIRSVAPFALLSVYGSDFYKAQIKKRLSFKKIITHINHIIFTNENTRQNFVNYYKDYKKKSSVLDFGSQIAALIDQFRHEEKLKSQFGVSEKDIIVTCGYSASSNQQHEAIIDHLVSLPKNILTRCHFIFPMTYGDSFYREKIIKKLKSTTINYQLLSSQLSMEQVAKLRLTTDIMINIPKSDQLSNSMLETFYAGGIVINGAWLPYPKWPNAVPDFRADSINAAMHQFAEIVKNYFHYKKQAMSTCKYFAEYLLWNFKINNWLALYSQLK